MLHSLRMFFSNVAEERLLSSEELTALALSMVELIGLVLLVASTKRNQIESKMGQDPETRRRKEISRTVVLDVVLYLRCRTFAEAHSTILNLQNQYFKCRNMTTDVIVGNPR